MRDRLGLALAILAATPMVLVTAWSLSVILPRFSDPCFEWAPPHRARSNVFISRALVRAGGPCRGYQRTSQTREGAIRTLILVHGGIVGACFLAIFGAAVRRPVLTQLGAGLTLVEAVPLVFSFGGVFLICAGLFLLAARHAKKSPGMTPGLSVNRYRG